MRCRRLAAPFRWRRPLLEGGWEIEDLQICKIFESINVGCNNADWGREIDE